MKNKNVSPGEVKMRRLKILATVLFLLSLCAVMIACNNRKDTEGNEINYAQIASVEVDKESIASGFMLKDFSMDKVILLVTYLPDSETGLKMAEEQAGAETISYTVKMPASYDMVKAEDKVKLTTGGSKTITIIFGKFELSFVITLFDNTETELYKVQFFAEDGITPLSEVQYVKEQGRAVVPALDTKDGYDFVGWVDKDTGKVATYDNIRKDTSYVAYFLPSKKEVKYTVKYRQKKENGGTEIIEPSPEIVIATVTVGRTESAEDYLPDPIDLPGYSFSGWDSTYINGENYFYAIYDKEAYDVTFVYRPYDEEKGRYSDSMITHTIGYYPDKKVINEPTDAYCEGISPDNDYHFIGWYVLHNGTKTDVTFPYNMSTVSEICFYGNYVDINAGSEGLTYKKSGNDTCLISGFSGRENVVVIPEKISIGGVLCNVVGMDDGVFKSRKIAGFVVSSVNRYFSVKDDILYNKEKTILYAYPTASEEENIVVPSGVQEISSYAFFRTEKLATVSLPDSLLRIDDFAFSECVNMASVTIPINVAVVEEGAFRMTSDSAITSLTFTGTHVSELGDEAFYGLNRLEKLTLPASVKTLGDGVFYGLSSLKEVSDGGNVNFAVYDGALYTSDYRTLILFPALNLEINNPEVILHENCRQIKRGAFYNSLLACITLQSTCSFEPYSIVCPLLGAVRFAAGDLELDEEELTQAFGGFMPSTFYVITGDGPYNFIKDSIVYYNPSEWTGYENIAEDGLFYARSGDTYTVLGYHGSAKSLTINDTYKGVAVTAIAPYAFYGNKSLTSVTLPRLLESIGEYSFYGCSSLTGFSCASTSLRAIGSYAFCNCTSLTSPFYGSSGPSGITQFGKYVFENTPYIEGTSDSIGFLVMGSVLLRYSGSSASVTVPGNVTYIASDAFKDQGFVTSVSFPSSSTLWYVDEYAFQNCIGIREFSFPASLKAVADYAFYGCSYLFNVAYNANAGDVEIGYYAYKNAGTSYTDYSAVYETYNDTLTYELTLQVNISRIYHSSDFHPIGNAYVAPREITLGNNLFLGWYYDMLFTRPAVFPLYIEKDTELYARLVSSSYISDGLTYDNNETGGYSVSGYNGADTSVVVPERYKDKPVTGINKGVFGDNILEVQLPSGLEFIEEGAFANTAWYKSAYGDFFIYNNNTLIAYKGNARVVRMPAGITIVANGAFKNNTSIEEVYLSASLTSIVDEMFYGCTSLKSITIGSSVVSIGQRAFYGCTSLETVTLAPGSSLGSIAAAAFDGTKWFENQTDDCIIINKIFYKYCGDATTLHIPEGVLSIASGAFAGNIKLRSVSLPTTLSSIGSGAFKDCALSEVVVPGNGSSLLFIMNSAFEGCYNLNVFDFASASILQEIGERAFYGCSSLGNVSLPSTLDTLDDYAFSYSGIKTVSFSPSSLLRRFGEGVFANCYFLSVVKFEGGSALTEIGEKTFSECIMLSDYINPYGETKNIGSEAFYNCISLNNFNVNAYTIETIDADAFYNVGTHNFESLTDKYMIVLGNILLRYRGSEQLVTIPKDIVLIYNSAFEGNTHLIEVVFEDGTKINNINDRAFYGCSNLETINFPMSISFVGNDVMTGTRWYMNALRNKKYIVIGTTLIKYNVSETIDVVSFGDEVVTAINKGAFAGSSIYNFTVYPGLELIKDGAFDGMIPASWAEGDKECLGYTITVQSPDPPRLDYDKHFENCYRIYFEEQSVLDTYRLNSFWNQQFTAKEVIGYTAYGDEITVSRIEILSRYLLSFSVVSSEGESILPQEMHALYSPITVNTFSSAKKQYEFVGWFMDRDYFDAVRYPLVLNKPITIYAKCVDYNIGSNPESFSLEVLSDDTYTITDYSDYSDKKLVIITEQSNRKISTISGHLGYIRCSRDYYYTVGFAVDDNVFYFVNDTVFNRQYFSPVQGKYREGEEYYKAKTVNVTAAMLGKEIPAGTYWFEGSNLVSVSGSTYTIQGQNRYFTLTKMENIDVYIFIENPDGSHEFVLYDKTIYDQGDSSYEFYYRNSVIEEITFANNCTITELGEFCFAGLDNLKKITLPKSLKHICTGAFADCTSLEEIVFTDGISDVVIEGYAFHRCASLVSVTIPEGIKELKDCAFIACNSLINIYATALQPYELQEGTLPFEKNLGLQIYVYDVARVYYESAWYTYRDYLVEIPSNTTGE